MPNQSKILVIDDESQILRALRTILTQQNYQIVTAGTGEDGLAIATASQPDLIILDLGLPDLNGIEVCRLLREWSNIPILVLSAHDNESEKVAALDAGADDFLSKPFGINELLARIRVAMRHNYPGLEKKDSTITVGALIIDLSKHMVTRDGMLVKLSATENKMLAFLASNAGRVLTHRMILDHVWGDSQGGQMEYLRIYIRQIRQKIEDDPRNPQMIITESGIGYRFVA